MARGCILPALLLGLVAAAAPAQTPSSETGVELELVLLADSSSSIRGPEFELQIGGYAEAFQDPGVIEAIQSLGGNGIAVTFIQWSASFQQVDAVGWTHIRTAADAVAFGQAIARQARSFQGFGTATGAAMDYGIKRFEDNGFKGRRQVIDLSSDEHSNQGPHPKGKRAEIIARGITLNGLAILDDDFALELYFRRNIIAGPGAFVMAVASYADFAEAIKLKLIREISEETLAAGPARSFRRASSPGIRAGPGRSL